MNRFSKKQDNPFNGCEGPVCQRVASFAIVVSLLLCGPVWGQQQTWDSSPATPPDTIRIPIPNLNQGSGFPAATAPVQRPIQDRFVRAADFHAPVEAIPDLEANNGGLMESLQKGAEEQVSGLFGSLQSGGRMGSQWKETFASLDIQKVFGSLAIVLGVYFGFVWIMRKTNGGRIGGLPREVVEVLGNAPFGPKKNLQLVRLGSKLLLLLHSPDGTTTIGEISDSAEVEYLTGVCTGKPTRTAPVPTAPAPIAPVAPPVATSQAPRAYQPEVTIPQHELENVVRKLANAARLNGGSVFEA